MKWGLRHWFLLNWENLGLAFIFRVSLKLKKEIIRYSPADGVFFFQSILQKPCFVKSFCFVITIYCFVAKYTYYTCWNGESLISAQPRISAHQLSRSKNVMSAQGGYSNKYGNTRSFGPCFKNHYSAQGHKTLDQTTLDTAILNSVKIRFNIWDPLYKKYAFIVPLFLLPNSD